MTNMAMSLAWLVMLQAQAESVSVDPAVEVSASGQTTVPAKVISRKPPSYPGFELKKRHQAWVRVAYCIDETGKPQNISVLDSVGNERFERAALRTVEDWQYEPALVDGVPTWQSRNVVYISFALDGGNEGARPSFVRQFRKLGRYAESLYSFRRLSLDNVEGQLDSIEMRCDHKRFTSAVSEEIEWQIPESWGTCRVLFYGEPGTRFDVLELPPG